MFSTIDSPSNRFLRYWLIREANGGSETRVDRIRVMPPDDSKYKRPIEMARAMPTEEHIRRIVFALAKEQWVESESPVWTSASGGDDSDTNPETSTTDAAPKGEFSFRQVVVAVSNKNKVPRDVKRARFDGIMIEAWKYVWDWKKLSVTAKLVRTYTLSMRERPEGAGQP